MLCRLSSLFIYVVAGLVISAAATPAMMGPTSDFNEEPKSRPMVPSYSKSPSHPKPYYPMDKAYARREDAPYPRPHRDEKKYSEKPHSEEKKWNDDKGKEHKPDNYKDRMSVDEKDRKDYGKGRKDDDRYHKDDDRDRKDDDKYRKDDDRDRKDDDKYRKDDDRDRKDGDRKDDDKDRKDRDRKDDDRDRKDKDRKDYDNGRKADHDKGRKDYEKVKNYDEAYNPSNAYCNVGEQHCCDTVNTVSHVLMVS